MARNLVVCLDGTNNEFGAQNTNVVRLFQALAEDPARQCRYYDPGVGTMGYPGALTRVMQKVTQVLGLAFGLGVTQNVIDAYQFLMRRYQDGDRIFIFGFSRGALEARALAAMLYRCGLLKPDLETLTPYAVRVFQTVNNQKVAGEFKATFSRKAEVEFLGLWDTVTAFGNVWTPIAWPNVTHNPSVRTVRHAVALDERRAFFRQNRWAEGDATLGQSVKERWFVGVHCDVGGGYPANESALWTLPMEWMVTEAAACGLLVDTDRVAAVTEEARQACADPQGWSSRVHDSMSGLGPIWPIAEAVPKRRWLGKNPDKTDHYEWIWPIRHWFGAWRSGHGTIGRARELRPGDHLHRSVIQRFAADPRYRPDPLVRIGMTTTAAQTFLATREESYVVSK
jgi:uncharacterized protein (DUF2235 family)